MALSKIIERINAQAENESREILAAAEQKVEEIVKLGQSSAATIATEIRAKTAALADAQKKRRAALAAAEMKNSLGEARQEAIEQAFTTTLSRLQARMDSEYLPLLRDLIVDAAETGEELIVLSPKDKSRVNAAFVAEVNALVSKKGLKGSMRVSDETRSLSGGAILVGDKVEINCSFDTTLKLIREDIEPKVAALLFGDGLGK